MHGERGRTRGDRPADALDRAGEVIARPRSRVMRRNDIEVDVAGSTGRPYPPRTAPATARAGRAPAPDSWRIAHRCYKDVCRLRERPEESRSPSSARRRQLRSHGQSQPASRAMRMASIRLRAPGGSLRIALPATRLRLRGGDAVLATPTLRLQIQQPREPETILLRARLRLAQSRDGSRRCLMIGTNFRSRVYFSDGGPPR